MSGTLSRLTKARTPRTGSTGLPKSLPPAPVNEVEEGTEGKSQPRRLTPPTASGAAPRPSLPGLRRQASAAPRPQAVPEPASRARRGLPAPSLAGAARPPARPQPARVEPTPAPSTGTTPGAAPTRNRSAPEPTTTAAKRLRGKGQGRRSDCGVVRLAEEHLALLTYIVRFGFVTREHLAELSGRSVKAIADLCYRWRKYGLVEERNIRAGITVVRATKAAFSYLPDVKTNPVSKAPHDKAYSHTFAVAHLALLLLTGKMKPFGDGVSSTLVTEREMSRRLYLLREVEGVDDPWDEQHLPLGVLRRPSTLDEHEHGFVIKARGVLRTHRPDLVAVSNGEQSGVVAFEIERSTKPRREYERIIRLYALSDVYDKVLYLHPDSNPRLGRVLREVIEQNGASEKIAVKAYSEFEFHAATHGGVASRSGTLRSASN